MNKRGPAVDQRVQNGSVDFTGGFLGKSYYMTFTREIVIGKATDMVRIVPGYDSATFPPSPSCSLRNAQPVVR